MKDVDGARQTVLDVLARVPGTGPLDEVSIEGLRDAQSLNNTVWLVSDGRGKRYAVRIADPAAADLLGIDRNEEEAALRRAATLGVSPDLLWYDAGTGNMVTRWVEASRTWTAADLRSDVGMSRLAAVLPTFHGADARPGERPAVHRRIEHLVRTCGRLDLVLPADIDERPDRLRQIEESPAPGGRAPLGLDHNDLWGNNILDDGTRVWLIDWEFAGPGDGYYDLATVSLSGEYSPDDERRFLSRCGLNRPEHLARLQDLKWVARFFEATWSLVMHGRTRERELAAPTGFDYAAHSRRMFEQL